MPDLIRHPETISLLDSGFRRNDIKTKELNIYAFIIAVIATCPAI